MGYSESVGADFTPLLGRDYDKDNGRSVWLRSRKCVDYVLTIQDVLYHLPPHSSPMMLMVMIYEYQRKKYERRSTPVAQLAPRNLLTRWDVSSIPANGIFLT